MKYTFDKNRPLSWSSISSFWWNKEEWFEKYILHYEQAVTKEMEFGKRFAQSIEDGNCPVPELMQYLTGKKEHPFNVKFGTIPLVGYADDFDDKTFRRLEEVKTGKKKWDQKRVDEHLQIDTYLLMNYITNKVRPEEVRCRLHWIQTEENGDFSISFVQPIKVHTFETKRTMQQILNFGMKVNKTYKEMQDFVTNHE
jgi:hypothetical protein